MEVITFGWYPWIYLLEAVPSVWVLIFFEYDDKLWAYKNVDDRRVCEVKAI